MKCSPIRREITALTLYHYIIFLHVPEIYCENTLPSTCLFVLLVLLSLSYTPVISSAAPSAAHPASTACSASSTPLFERPRMEMPVAKS
mmetsp:Transcript_18627/g.34513  ORF Transcript_18627/g.34513 Transcript_18627/m.34513 type:complete len:89 (+) Transcript_18627:121-387(+)